MPVADMDDFQWPTDEVPDFDEENFAYPYDEDDFDDMFEEDEDEDYFYDEDLDDPDY